MARVTPTVRRAISASALLLALAACGEGTGPSGPQPTSITIASGNFQSARYGAAVTSTPSVLVIGTNGPMAGVTVTFAVDESGILELAARETITGRTLTARVDRTIG